jgi:hypothetical protein
LRYRLVPISSELNPGDAAPIYLRVGHEIEHETWTKDIEKADGLLKMELKEFPVAEARQVVDRWAGRLKLLEFGTRRESCSWNFTLREQRLEAIGILLPDTQSMRRWASLLSLKARMETAEHAYDKAIDTIETGIAFGRHVGEGPFLINALVGISICNQMCDRLEELIVQPEAPNLYWALSAMPRPLVPIRHAMEVEQRIVEGMVPELSQVDEPRAPAAWPVLLASLHRRMSEWTQRIYDQDKSPDLESRLRIDLDAFKKECLEGSRDYLARTGQFSADAVKAMSEDEVAARALVGRYREFRDEYFKACYLPWSDARARYVEAETHLSAVKNGPFVLFARIQSSVAASPAAETRMDRRVAILRVVEAIRQHAATSGKLPETLSQVTEVPVPDDPATCKPFEFGRQGHAALLHASEAGIKHAPTSYRITIRNDAASARP